MPLSLDSRPNQGDVSGNPGWHGLCHGQMPPFPEALVRDVLDGFGINRPECLISWPYGPFDVLARFTWRGTVCLLKGRYVEQRGERALFETQRVQQRLAELGVPVSPFLASPSGETLCRGPDWQGEGTMYYEVQHILPGAALVPDADGLYRAGRLIAAFQQAGGQIDTFLLNKSAYVPVFAQRRFQALRHLQEHLHGLSDLAPAHVERLDQIFARGRDLSWTCHRSRALAHGDMSLRHLLDSDRRLHVIDLDEVGLGGATGDLVALLLDVPEPDHAAVEAVLSGYRDGAGHLGDPDLWALHDGLVVGTLRAQVGRLDGRGVGAVLARYSSLGLPHSG
ncbi:MAG: phosphotransferase [Candidatus Latescibacterota bacterium]